MTKNFIGTFNCPDCGRDFTNTLNSSEKWDIGEIIGCHCPNCNNGVFTKLLHIGNYIKERVIFT